MDTELLAKQAEWKKKIKEIREIIEKVNFSFLFGLPELLGTVTEGSDIPSNYGIKLFFSRDNMYNF